MTAAANFARNLVSAQVEQPKHIQHQSGTRTTTDPLGLTNPPDLELFDFLEGLNTDGWFFESQGQQQRQLQNEHPIVVKSETQPSFGGKRSYSSLTDRTDVSPSSRASSTTMASYTSAYSQKSEVSEAGTEITVGHSRPNGRMTAMEIFHNFTKWYSDEFGTLYVDASGIISRACYEQWLSSRKKLPARPEETFRKSILCHCTSSDGGSAPFPPEVEYALLKLLRQPGRVWPCFQGQVDKNGKPVNIGQKGLRATGYHEKKAAAAQQNAAKRKCM